MIEAVNYSLGQLCNVSLVRAMELYGLDKQQVWSCFPDLDHVDWAARTS